MLRHHREMSVEPAPLGETLQGPAEATLGRLPFNRPPLLPRSTPEVGKTQQVERPTPRTILVVWRGTPKIDEPSFLRMHGQSESGQPFGQHLQNPTRIMLELAHDDEVSSPGESHPRALAEPYVNLSAHTAPIIQPPA